MKNNYAFKRFAFINLLLLGFVGGSFAQNEPCTDTPETPQNEHLLYSMNGNASEILTTEKFKQTLDPSKKLWWFKSMDEPNSNGIESVSIDRSVPTYHEPYEFFIAYQDGDCFGERARVEVEVRTAPMPAVKDIDLCKDGTFDPLDGIVATDEGYELVWFKSPTDTAGKALSSAPTDVVDVTTPGKYILYVAQRATTEPYAQSDVTWFYVTIYDVKEPVDASRHEYCANEEAEELMAELVTDEKNYYYADEVVYVSGTAEKSTIIPDTKASTSKTYNYQAYQIFTTPRSKQVCKGPSIDIKVDVIAVEKPKVNHSVSYSRNEAFETKEFVDILVKSPDVIDNVEGQTLLWAVDQNGDYEKESTYFSKPYYDESLSYGYGIVEKQERWVKWEMTTAAGLTCQSEPEKIDIIIIMTHLPIVRNIEICEDVFKSGSVPYEKEPVNNALINANDGILPDAGKYELVWFDNQEDADEAMTNSSKLSLGRKTAPTLTDVFSGVDMSEPYESEWEATIYVVQSYDDGAGTVTTSPASPMRITVNATPKLQEEAHEPVCKGPVDLTRYWNLSNDVSVDEEYMYEGSLVTQNATNLTKSGKYTIVVTSLRGCKSEPLDVQLDIRNISLEMDPKSEVKSGTDISLPVKTNFSYNVDGREAKEGKVKLSWSSEENISDKPTDNGVLDPDAESFTYKTGKFDGKPGDTHTITISVTDGYCVSKATHIVTVEKQSAVDQITAENADDIVDVYTVSGLLVKTKVKRSEALNGLLEGIYVVGNKKVIVR